jgi:hypothetical protein
MDLSLLSATSDDDQDAFGSAPAGVA